MGSYISVGTPTGRPPGRGSWGQGAGGAVRHARGRAGGHRPGPGGGSRVVVAAGGALRGRGGQRGRGLDLERAGQRGPGGGPGLLRRAVRVVGRRRAAGIPRTAFTLGGLLVGGGAARRRGRTRRPVGAWPSGWPTPTRAAARTQELGGTVLLPPMDIPVGRFDRRRPPEAGLHRVGGARRARPWPGQVLMVVQVPFTGDEKQSLRVSLDRHRDAGALEARGPRRRRPAAGHDPVAQPAQGLVKHLATVEYMLVLRHLRPPDRTPPFDDDDPDADLRVRPDETTEDVLAFYGRARSAADKAIDELELEATGTAWFGDAVSRCAGADPHDRGDGPARRPRRHHPRAHRRDDRGPPAQVTGRAGLCPPGSPGSAPGGAGHPGGLARALGVRVWTWPRARRRSAMPSRNMWITNSRIRPIRNRMLGRYGLPGSR